MEFGSLSQKLQFPTFGKNVIYEATYLWQKKCPEKYQLLTLNIPSFTSWDLLQGKGRPPPLQHWLPSAQRQQLPPQQHSSFNLFYTKRIFLNPVATFVLCSSQSIHIEIFERKHPVDQPRQVQNTSIDIARLSSFHSFIWLFICWRGNVQWLYIVKEA